MVFELDKFVSTCLEASRRSDPVGAVRDTVRDALNDRESILACLPVSTTEDPELLLYRSADLTIYRVLLIHGLVYPPHEHGMPVVIGLYAGCETNYLYARSKNNRAHLIRTGQFQLTEPEVKVLDGDIIHAVTNVHVQPAAGIHIYFGDIDAQERSLWTLDLDGECLFTDECYFARSRPLS